MRKTIVSALLLVLVGLVPAALDAQRRPAAPSARYEFGVDVGAAYSKPENQDGGIEIGTPVDVRVGLVRSGRMMWEPRFTFGFSSVGGTSRYAFGPGVNVLYAMEGSSHRQGMFLTGGGGLLLVDDGTTSGTVLSINGAIGWRKPYGSAAWRYELGIRYEFENQDLGEPATFNIGGRIGVSLWR